MAHQEQSRSFLPLSQRKRKASRSCIFELNLLSPKLMMSFGNNGETDIENRLMDMGRGEEKVRCVEGLHPFHVIRINKMLSCAGADRLQTGMRGAFGKPQGTVARVHSGQVIMSIRTNLQNKEHVIEALRRAKFKFPGRQKIHISKKWGFTKFNADEFENMVAEKRLISDGCGVKYIPNSGPLDKWRALHS
ncbi:unnamed protein product [Rangifer tarandus platyrhynchus]|uniref:Uncharacterized protein n=1 Tax=Rangifer tarandus platyrhynchus TaxID=3082113 RepID=A0AC59ZNU6_RANTA